MDLKCFMLIYPDKLLLFPSSLNSCGGWKTWSLYGLNYFPLCKTEGQIYQAQRRLQLYLPRGGKLRKHTGWARHVGDVVGWSSLVLALIVCIQTEYRSLNDLSLAQEHTNMSMKWWTMPVVFALLSADTVISTIIAHRTESKGVKIIVGIVTGGKNSICNKKLKVIIPQAMLKSTVD